MFMSMHLIIKRNSAQHDRTAVFIAALVMLVMITMKFICSMYMIHFVKILWYIVFIHFGVHPWSSFQFLAILPSWEAA